MIADFFRTLIYEPLYNLLIFILNAVPGADVGIAVLLLTLFIKFLLFPLSRAASETSIKMRLIKGDLDVIKEKHKDDQQAQAFAMFSLFKEHKINPLSGVVILFIQIPIILGLYWVFLKAPWPEITTDILYSFVSAPKEVSLLFLGLVDVTAKSALFALFAGITQFIHMRIVMPDAPKKSAKPDFKNDLARNMHIQMRFFMPILIAIIAYTLPSAIAIYWTTSNIFTIGQEVLIRKRIEPRLLNSRTKNEASSVN